MDKDYDSILHDKTIIEDSKIFYKDLTIHDLNNMSHKDLQELTNLKLD